VIEHFPIGRRLAYDEAKGRLWVVCAKCRRWNLTPLEERWEAIEECEREFEGTRLRVSTDNIVLARVRGGLDLVRIGAPSFPEMAAWRYGRSLVDRWRRRTIPAAVLAGSGYVIQAITNGEVIGFGIGIGLMTLTIAPMAYMSWHLGRVRVMLPDGRVVLLKHRDKDAMELEPDVRSGWALRLKGQDASMRATGVCAQHAMRGVLAAVNHAGGSQRTVSEAVALLQRLGGAERYLARLSAVAAKHGVANINFLPAEMRLGLEMALHEDVEREAMTDELGLLQDEWQLAEEVAQIADNMFVGDAVLLRLGLLKRARATQ